MEEKPLPACPVSTPKCMFKNEPHMPNVNIA